jgi:NAD(P)-dependent dehydrogenase (short-subunit alcohol dehydrogenase family)
VSVIAIIGAGPGLGAAVARRFGREGFSVALISRDQSKLDTMASELTADGVTATGYAANVLVPADLKDALARAAAELGPITALQYSPLPSKDYLKPVLDLTPELALEALSFSALGLIHAARAVLPAMREAGTGSIILINGGTSVKARHGFAGTSVAFPSESAYGEMLSRRRVSVWLSSSSLEGFRSSSLRTASTTSPTAFGDFMRTRASSAPC